MRKLFIVSFIIFSVSLYAQDISKEDKKILAEAEDRFEFGDYHNAVKLFSKLYAKDSLNDNFRYKLGVSYYYTKDYKKSAQFLRKASVSKNIEVFRYKAALAHLNSEFRKAINFYNGYKIIRGDRELSNEEVGRLINKIIYAEESVNNKQNVTITNIGSVINTKDHEYVPLISADQSMLFFTSRREGSTGGLLDPNGQPFEDVYVSYRDKSGYWEDPKQLREGINTATNDACVGLSADGQRLFLFKTNEDLSSGDLYESRMGLYDWEDPLKLGSDINSEFIESSASIAPNDKVLYFSSNREGGYGGKDIYKVRMLPNGKWSRAQNLGPIINTPYDEDAPFIDAEGKTLFFSSTGHQNMGGYDVFKSTLENNLWSNPENLGYPVNTVNDDVFYVQSADGKTGYYSSSKAGGYGGQDVYKISFNNVGNKLHVLKGFVFDAKDEKNLLSSKITLIENESKKVQGIYKSKEVTGKFILLVEPSKSYSVVVESDNYHSYTSELEFNINELKSIKFKLEKKEIAN